MKKLFILSLLFCLTLLVEGGHFKGRKVADYNVSGELTPDATCNYWYAGEYNTKPYYRRADGAWFIWWHTAGVWYISDEIGSELPPLWFRCDPEMVGDYEPAVATGTATVSAGEH